MKKEDKKALEEYRAKLSIVRNSGTVSPFENENDKQKRIEKAKKDIAFCVRYYFPHYATSDCASFQIKSANDTLKNPVEKKFDEWGRGLAKSVWDDIIKPFWLWMHNQAHYHVIVTTSKDRAEELLDDLRAEWEANPRIINDFGEQYNPGQWEKGFYITKSGFIGKALGAGQSVRGLRVKAQRPDLITVDDLETKETIANPKRQKKIAKWIERDLIPTMDGPIRRMLYANNKFAPIMIQTLLQERHPDWTVHSVPAYNPVTYKPTWYQKYSKDYYLELEKEIGVLAARAEYNNDPHIEGEIFKEEQIQWGKRPHLNHFKIIVGHWDIAYAGTPTSDYNAVRVWGLKDKDFWYIDSFVYQCKMRLAVAWICEFILNLPDTVVVHWQYESQFWNDEVERTINEVFQSYGLQPIISKVATPRGNKYDRILTLQPYYQNGRIFYDEQKKPHRSTQVGLQQLYGIEPGYKTKDDAPDADHQAITFLSKHIYMGNNTKPKIGKYTIKNYW